MKINKFFIAALAAMTLFASCSKDNEGVQAGGDAAEASMKIRMSFSDDTQTYAVDSPVTNNTTTNLTSAVLYQMKGNLVLSARVLTSTEITELKSATGFRLSNVNQTVDGVTIIGNYPTGEVSALQALANKAAIETYAFAIANQQSTTANTGVTNVTMVGFGAATDAAGTTTPKLKEANVTITPLVGRIEVSGTPGISADPSNQIQSIAWSEVSFNRFYNDGGKTTMTNLMGTLAGLPAWAKDAHVATTEGTTPSKCYAYHFFPHTDADAEKLPMIILKGTVTLKGGAPALTDHYITIKTFKSGANALTKMVPNRVYKVSLASLSLKHSDFTPEPSPEQVDLAVKVTVAPWTVETITPEV